MRLQLVRPNDIAFSAMAKLTEGCGIDEVISSNVCFGSKADIT